MQKGVAKGYTCQRYCTEESIYAQATDSTLLRDLITLTPVWIGGVVASPLTRCPIRKAEQDHNNWCYLFNVFCNRVCYRKVNQVLNKKN